MQAESVKFLTVLLSEFFHLKLLLRINLAAWRLIKGIFLLSALITGTLEFPKRLYFFDKWRPQ